MTESATQEIDLKKARLRAQTRRASKAYYHRNKALCKARGNAYRLRPGVQEHYRQLHKAWRARNLAHAKEWVRLHRLKNRKRFNDEMAAYRKAHPELRLYMRTYTKKWRAENPEKCYFYSSKRRSRIRNVTVDPAGILTVVKKIRRAKSIACYYCGVKLSGKRVHIDHIKPLIQGGAHSSSNLCAACPTCNLNKKARLLTEWEKHPQTFLPL